MESKDKYLKNRLAELGKFDYTEEQFYKLKSLFIDNVSLLKMPKEKAFENAYKTVFGGEKK
ncbi:hypothetical protein SAMN06265182_1234 [Persephonella hydrogeniphila]|uniref:Uncharacterized protein n=1 Tax=Persephonella hydrogeniphila TaxID=198703 RepID=A0A285NFK3_9AQUI|nr:hypothetical protein [Persephonella hydrogeniphila]SNZ08250.1 hypothetical protein SAMN06265182_1234 [Persephonella hydrogeniphila]